jgi:hypothetical protein
MSPCCVPSVPTLVNGPLRPSRWPMSASIAVSRNSMVRQRRPLRRQSTMAAHQFGCEIGTLSINRRFAGRSRVLRLDYEQPSAEDCTRQRLQEVHELQQGCADQSKTRIPHFLHLLQALTEKTATDPNATAFGSSVIPSLAPLEQKA